MDSAKLTVLIANHNYGQWISHAIKSAANQTLPPNHIVVTDDGSTDNSVEILTNLFGITNAKPNSPLRGKYQNIPATLIILPKPTGPSNARNIGIKATWGITDFYAVLDADDEFLPTKLQRVVDVLNTDPIIGAVYHDYDTVNIVTGLVRREYKEPFSHYRLRQECIVHSACTIRKEALEKIGLYNVNYRVCEDFELWLRMSKQYMIMHIPESLMRVKTGSYNATGSVSTEIWQAHWHDLSKRMANGEF